MLPISTETLAKVAATLTAAIIEQDCIDDPKLRGGDVLQSRAIIVFGEMLERLELNHGTAKGGKLFNTNS